MSPQRGFKLPLSTRANTIGYSASDALKETSGKVHSVFDRTFNVLVEGNLIGIARKGVPANPTNVGTEILPPQKFTSLGIEKGMTVRAHNQLLSVDRIIDISLKNAVIWKPKTFVEEDINIDKLYRNIEAAKKFGGKLGRKDGGFARFLRLVEKITKGIIPNNFNLTEVAEKALPHLVHFIQGAKKCDSEVVKKHSYELVGLGSGLTPSADDLLSGFMTTNWWVNKSLDRDLEKVKTINNTIVEAADKTNLVSQQLLKYSAKGETNEEIEKLLESIFKGTIAEIRAGEASLSEIGETSGLDTLVGILLRLELERIQ